MLSLEAGTQLFDLDPGLEAGRVELVCAWCEENVDADLLGEPCVAFLVARVAREILVRPELGRIDEEAGDDDIVLCASCPEEGEVAVVEGAHRGDEPEGSGRFSGTELCDRSNELHER